MSTPEGNVKKDIKEWMDEYLPDAWGWMPVKAVYGVSGIPDYVYSMPVEITQEMVGSTAGLFVGIEAKSSKGRQSPTQKDREADITGAGGIYLLVRGCHSVEPTLRKLLSFKMSKEPEHLIKINDRFSIGRDAYNWIVFEAVPSKRRDGSLSTTLKKSYHPNLERASRHIIDKRLGDCKSMEEMLRLLAGTIKLLHRHLVNESNTR